MSGTEASEPGAAWRKSSYSVNNGACVEVGTAFGAVAVRDLADRSGHQVLFPLDAWRDFIVRAKSRGSGSGAGAPIRGHTLVR